MSILHKVKRKAEVLKDRYFPLTQFDPATLPWIDRPNADIEDIKIDSGPLYYYRGSHQIPKFNFGTGILWRPDSTRSPLEFAEYLDKTCEAQQLPKETLLIKKGDVLIWHSALAHGGGIITNPEQTRKSYVCHYSTEQALPFHRNRPSEVPVKQDYNGIYIYNNPALPQSEDTMQ